ncbi:unnamed protein product [Psylliodes chrysocephalus]|uniref:BED-type domain-containing protein n=1 Tax=Psylliodes chrysocephalus TaxID=3402493 RepID=A0A9P0CNS5_9CUCU|nr:unnamed protein product [Psylliodes chrysocephala]
MSMRNKKSVLWNFFNPTSDDKARCTLCNQSISCNTSISNLKRHMQRKHPLVQISSEVSTNRAIILPSQLAEAAPPPLPEIELSPSDETEPFPSTNSIICTITQPQSAKIKPGNTLQTKLPYLRKTLPLREKNKIDNSLMDLFTKDFQPFSVVEDEGFRNFTKCLYPTYELPNKKTITHTLLPALYEKTFTDVQEEIKYVKSVTVTTDCWTSINTESYMAVTVHFINQNFDIKSILLHCAVFPQSHTAEHLAEELKKNNYVGVRKQNFIGSL